MALGRKLAYNVSVNVVVKVATTALSLVGIGIMTRYLGTAGFGDYATVLAFFALFVALSDFGLYQITAREIGKQNAQEEERTINRVFALRLCISGITALIAIAITPFLPYNTMVRGGIAIVAVAFFFGSSYGILNSVFQKHLRMDLIVIAEFCGKALQIGWIAIAAHQDAGFLWVVGGMAAGLGFNFLSALWLVRRFIRLTPIWDSAHAAAFVRMALPLGAAAIVTFFYFKIDTLLLSVLQDAHSVGIYGAAYKILENLIFFPAMVMGLMLPILSRTHGTPAFSEYANKTLKVFVVIILPLLVGIFLRAEDIMRIVGGADFAYMESAAVLRILSLALAAIFFGQFFTTLLVVGALQTRLLIALSIAAVINVTGNMILIPRAAHMGAAIMSAITEWAVVILCGAIVVYYMKYSPRIPQFLRIVSATAILTAVLFATRDLSIFSAMAIGGVVYMGALSLTRAISVAEIRSIIERK